MVLLYLFSLLGGFLSIGFFGYLWLKDRSRFLVKYIRFLLCYTLMLVLLAIGVYYLANMSPERVLLDRASNILISLIFPGMGALIYTMPDFYHEFCGVPLRGFRRGLFTAMALLSMFCLAGYWLFRNTFTGLVFCMSYLAVFMAAAAYSTAILLKNRETIAVPFHPGAAWGVVLFFFVSSVFSGLEVWAGIFLFPRGTFSGFLFSLPLFYLVWNVSAVIYTRRCLLLEIHEEQISPLFLEEYGITVKEAEIVKELLAGKSNKQIASDLGLSQNTVRNHIYNVYLKTASESRVELINAIRRFKPK